MNLQPVIRQVKGFTLIELMVGLAVAAILLTVAVPSFNKYIANQRARAAGQDLFTAINYARSEAIKRNGTVTLEHKDDNWDDGWIITFGGATIREQQRLVEITLVGSANLQFNRDGRTSSTSTSTFTACDSGKKAIERLITVSPSGRPNISLGGQCS